ncbi:MAG: MarR family transcriptional regulator [Candidatus Bathyarchaeota archaeon]|nr:MarR family transcriptional regulator [Candidatus Bathyarchaeum sp.]
MKPNNTQTAEQTLKEIENKLVDTLTSLSYLKGRTPKHSKITALTYIHKKITQKQLREHTGYSMGTISNILQSLEKMGIIHKTQDPQTREYNYELEGTITQPGSRSVTNIFEYFAQQKEFLNKIKAKLDQPHISNKKGYQNINEFINKMNAIFPAIEKATQKMLTQISDKNGSEQN